MKTPEGKIKEECRQWLREQGAYVFSPVQMGYGASTLDDLVCWRGLFVGIEYKIKGKSPTVRQDWTIRKMRKAGGIAFVVHNLEELKWMIAETTKGLNI
jgi:hypothetical protein